jgi:hypothetical protein
MKGIFENLEKQVLDTTESNIKYYRNTIQSKHPGKVFILLSNFEPM